jgi:hypothetical protein
MEEDNVRICNADSTLDLQNTYVILIGSQIRFQFLATQSNADFVHQMR